MADAVAAGHAPKLYEPGVKPESLNWGPKLSSAGIIGGALQLHRTTTRGELGRYIHTGHAQTAQAAVDAIISNCLEQDIAELAKTWRQDSATVLDDPVECSTFTPVDTLYDYLADALAGNDIRRANQLTRWGDYPMLKDFLAAATADANSSVAQLSIQWIRDGYAAYQCSHAEPPVADNEAHTQWVSNFNIGLINKTRTLDNEALFQLLPRSDGYRAEDGKQTSPCSPPDTGTSIWRRTGTSIWRRTG